VYFSAGVGRTGVFITLSIVLERMRYEGVVDMFQTVKMLRTQRPAMVQTEVCASTFFYIMIIDRGSGLVVRAVGWHAGDPGSIRGRDGRYAFGCIPQHFEYASFLI
jgi:hypothetical protein